MTVAPRADPDALTRDQAQAHVGYVNLAAAGMAVVILCLGVALWPDTPHDRLVAWLVLLGVPFAARVALARASTRQPEAWPAARLVRAFRVTFAVHGLVWAASTALVASQVAETNRLLLAFVMVGVTSSALNTSAFDRTAGRLVLSIAALPWIAWMLIQGGRFHLTIGVMLTLHLAYMLAIGAKINRRYVADVALRRATDARADALAGFQQAFARLWQAEAADPAELVRSATREVAAALGVPRVRLFLFDERQDAAVLAGRAGDAVEPGGQAPVVPLSALPAYLGALSAGRLTGHGAAALAAHADTVGTPLAPTPGWARLDVPLGGAGRLAGVLCCERRDGPWTQDEETFVMAAAAALQAAAEEARRRDAERRLRDLNQNLERVVETRTSALHESELRFRALFDKSPVVVTLVDMAESRIAEMNEVGLRTFGYARDEVLGRTTIELGFWADEPERRRAARRLIDTGLLSGVELQLRRKSGEVFWGLLNSTVVTFQGRPYALMTLLDITGRRELEARVLQSQKMEVVGHLAGGVAHDFNNVLTVITSTAELAMSGTRDGDPMYEALQTIRAASTRAARLTGQLLAFSRRQILQPAPLDLNDVVSGLAPMIRRVVGDAVVVQLDITGAPISVVADRGSLEQVILNLAINARDAMPDGGTLAVAVGTAMLTEPGARGTTLPPGAYAALRVADSGTGMSEATRRRIFEPFFTTKEVGKGTGLGLSMAHGVVQQSRGDIVVESRVGVGSDFTIYLPLSTEAPVAAAPPSRHVTTGSETVLVVDDDPDIREVLRRALKHAGYDVSLAGTGEEALVELQKRDGRVDLLLTDVMMPGIGGRELAERVRAGHPSARILFTSGYAENAIAHQGILADGVQFIAKPYSLQALTKKVREVLDR